MQIEPKDMCTLYIGMAMI